MMIKVMNLYCFFHLFTASHIYTLHTFMQPTQLADSHLKFGAEQLVVSKVKFMKLIPKF